MTKQSFINPFTGKFDYHGFKLAKKAKKQTHYFIKQEKALNDGKVIEITAKAQSQLFNIMSETPIKAEKTVLHTKQKLLPALAMEQRSLRIYSYELAEVQTNLVVVNNVMSIFQHEITIIS